MKQQVAYGTPTDHDNIVGDNLQIQKQQGGSGDIT
jgi:hypothetical protein